ncbi:MAG TPA: DUF4082 domain-containing protein [Candidatus Saccharimonadia bacterium]|nr:DUF4082 domain-containing protein [Candidatus Saccharimonadia bacterium]
MDESAVSPKTDGATTAPLDSLSTAGVVPPAQNLNQSQVGVRTIGSVQPNVDMVGSARPGRLGRFVRRFRVAGLVVLVLIAGVVALARRNVTPANTVKAGNFNTVQLGLAGLAPETTTTAAQALRVNGQLQVASSLVLNPTLQPASSVAGQMYYDQSSNLLNYYNGSQYVPVAGNTTFIQGATNVTNVGGNTVINATAGTGTAGRLVKFTGAQSTGDSIVTDNGTHIQVNGGVNLLATSTLSDLDFWPTNPIPAVENSPDGNGPVELGTKFTADVAGQVRGLRFYKGSQNTGAHTGRLWTSTGTILASVTFTAEGASGWQTALFSSPVSISPDTTYVISYHTGAGFYAANNNYFGSNGADNGPLHALASGIDGGNGVFNYGTPGTFPTRTFSSSNYWVDVVFTGATYDLAAKYRVNGAQIASGDLANDSNIAKRGSAQIFSGHNIFRNANDSLDAFSIQKANTTPLFTVSTANLRVIIGPGGGDTDGTILVLGNKIEPGDPSGTEGAIYYNRFQKMFRCYRDGEWSDCTSTTVDQGFSVEDEFMGGQTNSFSPNDNIGSLGWHATAIGANGAIDFNPATPAAVADRPGVLALQTPAVASQGTTLMLGNTSGGSAILQRGDILKTAVAVGATAGLVLRIGLHGETSGTTAPVSGVWWEANPAVNPNWQYCYGDGVAATCTPTTNLIVANAWVRLSINVSGVGVGTSEATFGINGSAQVVTAVTIDGVARMSPALSFYATGGAARDVYWDYFQLKGTANAAR